MRILFLTYGTNQTASSRVRVYQYLPYLKAQGIGYSAMPYHKYLFTRDSLTRSRLYRYTTRVRGWVSERAAIFKMLFLSLTHDIVFVQKVLLSIWTQRLLFRMNKRIIFDVDDSLWANPRLYNELLFESMLRSASHVILASVYNLEYTRRFNQNITVITGPVDCERYKPCGEKKGYCVIGWIGSQATEKYLNLIQKPLREVMARFNVKVELIGASDSIAMGCAKNWFFDQEVRDLARFDIGIAPLADDEWSRGKGGSKLLQYMAMGIPSVASPVGINKDIVINGQTGFLCEGYGEWIDSLSRLVIDEPLRERMGKAARQRALEYFSLAKEKDRFIEILKGLRI